MEEAIDLLGIAKLSSMVEQCSLEQLEDLCTKQKQGLAEAKLAEITAFRSNFSSSLIPIQ